MNQHKTRRDAIASGSKGFTLIELMIVVAIVGILAAIAYPSYRDSVRRSHRSEGQALLLDTQSREERYYSNNNTYTTDMTKLGYSADPVISENQYYSVDAAAPTSSCPITSCYKLTATAQGSQSDDTHCATMSIDSLGQRTGTNTDCW